MQRERSPIQMPQVLQAPKRVALLAAVREVRRPQTCAGNVRERLPPEACCMLQPRCGCYNARS